MCGRVREKGIALRACEAASDINRGGWSEKSGMCERVYGRCECVRSRTTEKRWNE